MKTASQTTLKKNLSKVTISKNTVAYKMLLEAISGKKLLRPCYVQGSGKHIKNQDHSLSLEKALREVGIEFTTGNDAPRGGLPGKFIEVKTKIKA